MQGARTAGIGTSLEQNAGGIASMAVSTAAGGLLGSTAEAAVGGTLVDAMGDGLVAWQRLS